MSQGKGPPQVPLCDRDDKAWPRCEESPTRPAVMDRETALHTARPNQVGDLGQIGLLDGESSIGQTCAGRPDRHLTWNGAPSKKA